MNDSHIKELEQQGFCIVPNLVGDEWLEKLRSALDGAFNAHREIQIKNGNDITTDGVALHVILSNDLFIDFLDELIRIGFIDDLKNNYFKSNFILNSFSALDNKPGQLNFSSIVHRDLRFYTGEIPVMLNALVMLDDFTEENGPTLLLGGSHKTQEKPSDDYFHTNASKALGKAGDILIFNANVWHASSLNRSVHRRRAMPITFTKSLIKQLLDYPRALGYERMDFFNERLRQLLGYHARVPANLEEWYQPFEKRFYKKESGLGPDKGCYTTEIFKVNPFVNIIMVTYNHEQFIAQAIESVLMQKTDFDCQLIIGDDCSTDATLSICEDYAARFSDKIKILKRKKNVGMMHNFIDVFNECSGKYVAILDGDDYWTRVDKIQQQVDFLEKNPDFIVCFHDSFEVDSSGDLINKYNLNVDQIEITTLEDLSSKNYIYTASSVFRRDVINKLPEWFYLINAADYPLHLLLAQYGKLKFLKEKMSAYRIHSGGLFTNTKIEALAIKNIQLLNYLRNHFKKNKKVVLNLNEQTTTQVQTLLHISYGERRLSDFFNYFLQYVKFADGRLENKNILEYVKQLFRLILKKLVGKH